jgi:hypothetical protein
MALEEYGEGSCINCGLLGRRHEMDGPIATSVDYASRYGRETGDIGVFGTSRGDAALSIYNTRATCFVGKADLSGEIGSMGGMLGSEQQEKTLVALTKQRECPRWYPFAEFFSPREHLDMQMLDEQRRWQERESARNREHEERMADMQRQWQEDRDRAASRGQRIRFGWELAVFGFGIAAVMIAAALIERGSWLGSGPGQTIVIEQEAQEPPDVTIVVPTPPPAPSTEEAPQTEGAP